MFEDAFLRFEVQIILSHLLKDLVNNFLMKGEVMGGSVRLKLAFCTTCAVRVLVLAQGPSF